MILSLLLTAALLHPVHETVSEVEWNHETKRLEVALRFDPLDEQWLKSKLAADKDVAQWAVEYLGRRFRIMGEEEKSKSDSSERIPQASYHWIGRDDKKSHVWWYFEIEPADHQKPRSIDQRILFERNDGQVNRILFLGQVPRRAVTLTIQRPKAYLDEADDEQISPSTPNSGSRLDRR